VSRKTGATWIPVFTGMKEKDVFLDFARWSFLNNETRVGIEFAPLLYDQDAVKISPTPSLRKRGNPSLC
jgi:hypothetical protein